MKKIEKVEDKGDVNVLNGRNKIDTASYTCLGCEEYLDQSLFDSIVIVASNNAKQSLKHPNSFIPTSIDLFVAKQDSLYYTTGEKVDSCFRVYVTYKSIGTNSYGAEGEVKSSSVLYIVNHSITDLEGKLKEEPLAFSEDGDINRSLYLSADDGSISILPMKTKGQLHLMVISTQSCVDKGALLSITFENGEDLKLRSWNDFNCKSNSYYELRKSDLEKLKANKLKYVMFYGDESIFCDVPKNNVDYLMQFANLVLK